MTNQMNELNRVATDAKEANMANSETFTLRNGSEVYRSLSTSGNRLAIIPDDAESLSDVEIKAIHKMAVKLQRDKAIGAVANNDLCLIVMAPGSFIPESWIVA